MEFTRGDTFAFKFLIKLANGAIITKEDIDTLFITARKYPTETSPILFQKTLDDVEIDKDGYCHAKINPEDTEKLTYTTYCFDAEITLKNGYRKSKLFEFELMKETTMHGSGDSSGI